MGSDMSGYYEYQRIAVIETAGTDWMMIVSRAATQEDVMITWRDKNPGVKTIPNIYFGTMEVHPSFTIGTIFICDSKNPHTGKTKKYCDWRR